jgi:Na+-transporting NADH:ubiquinone oxidoreductase subunit NqrC
MILFTNKFAASIILTKIIIYLNAQQNQQFFFDKEHVLISRRYQLHPTSATTSCPNGIKDAHIQKRYGVEELQKKKLRYRDRKL